MITLITGVPGAGKSLFALSHVKARGEREQRVVWQNGVTDCKLASWQRLDDPEKWHRLPDGAIIVIDECQRVFRPRGTGSAVPEWVAALETHRHRGFDIYLVTQHPNLVDANVRRLVGQHFHLLRGWRTPMMMLRGLPGRAWLHEWAECQSPISRSHITSAQRSEFMYPAEVFGWYKSAELHTHARKVPARVVFLWMLPVIIGALAYVFYSRIHSLVSGDHVKASAGLAAGGGGAVGAASPALTPAGVKRDEYLTTRMPRMRELAYTAPIYDKLTEPTRVPVPAACAKMRDECRCYTQDATPLEVSDQVCSQIVAHGVFFDFDPEGRARRKDEALERPQRDLNRGGGTRVPGGAVAVVQVSEGGSGGYSAVPLSSPGGSPVALSSPDSNEGLNRRPGMIRR